MTLLKAQQNHVYSIVGVSGEEKTRRRLLDMGFTPGTKIFVSGVAPFGGTVLVGIRGALIALRDDAASLITLQEEDN